MLGFNFLPITVIRRKKPINLKVYSIFFSQPPEILTSVMLGFNLSYGLFLAQQSTSFSTVLIMKFTDMSRKFQDSSSKKRFFDEKAQALSKSHRIKMFICTT
jgi:hypothetical protein